MEYPSPGPLSPSKRARALSEIEERPCKKLKQSYHRHHSIIHKLQKQPVGEPAILRERDLDKLLIDAIKSICEEVQSKEGLGDCDIGSLALEAFRNATEEFILNICSAVRTHMRAARRTVPIATDFQSAVTFLNVPLDSSQLLPYSTNPTINPTLLPTPPPDDPFHNSTPLPADILGPDLVAQKRPSFIPSTLPLLPSKHTYRDTAIYPSRETDARRIRELATSEGKLGEEALRKLTSVNTHSISTYDIEPPDADISPKPRRRKRRRTKPVSMEQAFEEAMRDLMKAESGGASSFELGPVVNSEKRLWRPDEMPARVEQPKMPKVAPVGGYDTAPPPLSKTAAGKENAFTGDNDSMMELG